MDFRTRRQFVVMFAVSVVAAGVIFLAYQRFAPAPTCSDNRKNQGEEEADCGGPCIPCVFRYQQNVEVFWVRVVQSRSNTYDVAAEIRNPNVKLGAASFSYEFTLIDSAGIEVVSRRGESFIYPGETTHLVEVGLISARVIRNAEIVIENPRWVLSERIAPDLAAGSREYFVDEEHGAPRSAARARISNRTISDIPGILVQALAFDLDGNLLGVHRTVLDRLGSGETKAVEFRWPIVFSQSVASLVIEAKSKAGLPPS